MLNMTAVEPTKYSFATPEEFKSASEKVVHFWVGALSPMWVPFWASASFGVGAWAVAQSLSKSGDFAKDLPQLPGLASQWPGFMTPKPKDVTLPAAVAQTVVVEPVAAAVEMAETVSAAVVETVTETAALAEQAVETVTESVVEAAAPVEEAVVDAPPVLIEPVTEVPATPAVMEAIAETPAVAAEVTETAVESVTDVIAETVKAAEGSPATEFPTPEFPIIETPAPAPQPVAKPVAAKAAPRPIAKELSVSKPEEAPEVGEAVAKPAPRPKKS